MPKRAENKFNDESLKFKDAFMMEMQNIYNKLLWGLG